MDKRPEKSLANHCKLIVCLQKAYLPVATALYMQHLRHAAARAVVIMAICLLLNDSATDNNNKKSKKNNSVKYNIQNMMDPKRSQKKILVEIRKDFEQIMTPLLTQSEQQ
eukprot:scaffold647905_cov51-Prasinocladus_malaysianus.AAC.1